MQTVIPALRVKSCQESKPFYATLGFAEQWTHRFGPDFPIFASIVRSMSVLDPDGNRLKFITATGR